MVADLNDADMRLVVLGERGCAGILKCWIEDKGSCNHKRSHAESHQPTAVAGKRSRWVFFIERADGSLIHLHPNDNEATVDHCEVGSWGHGAFKHYKDKDVKETLKFVGAKHAKISDDDLECYTPQSLS